MKLLPLQALACIATIVACLLGIISNRKDLRQFLDKCWTIYSGWFDWNSSDSNVVRRIVGRRLLAVMILVWAFCVVLVKYQPDRPVNQGDLGRLLHQTCWICYDPSGTKLDQYGFPQYPTCDSIENDLNAIKKAGFTGIVTFGSSGVMATIPELAKKHGLAVIMGVWDPRSDSEIIQAIRQCKNVDAYCIGHDGIKTRYSDVELTRAIDRVKRRTGRPVATTEEVRFYDDRLVSVGDWLFPDAHISVGDNPTNMINVTNDISSYATAIQKMVTFAQTTQRLLIFKCVAYPHSGIVGASPENQDLFFRKVLDTVQNPQQGLPVKVSIIALGAFDSPWKVGSPYKAWDPYTGLIRIIAPSLNSKGTSTSNTSLTIQILPAARSIMQYYRRISADEPATTKQLLPTNKK